MKTLSSERCVWTWKDGKGRAEFRGFELRVALDPWIGAWKWRWLVCATDGRVLATGKRVSCRAAKEWARGCVVNQEEDLRRLARPLTPEEKRIDLGHCDG